MKKIEAVISPSQLKAVRAELRLCGVHAVLTLIDVRRDEGSTDDDSTEDKANRSLRHFLKLELIVGDRLAQRAINAIRLHSQLGHLAVLEVSETFQIVAPLLRSVS
jgi:nitrogen regulatory protein PII